MNNTAARPVLVLLPQSPFDPASGAARSVLNAARVLAAAGMRVRVLGTTASAAATPVPALDLFRELGVRCEVDRRAAVGRGCPVLRLVDRGVHCTLMDSGTLGIREVDFPHGLQLSRLLLDELEQHTPAVVLTLGGSPGDQDRRAMCREAGAAVVLALHSLGYLHPLAFDHVDAVWSGSGFVAARYAAELGVESTVLAPLIDPADTLPAERGRAVVFVNPTPGKGVYAAVTIADALLRRGRAQEFLVFETRGTREHFLAAARAGGLDLSAHWGLRFSGVEPRPRDLLARAGVVLVPSAAPEPVGRLALEAVAAGVPVVASDRGALAGLAGVVGARQLTLPAALTEETERPVHGDAIGAWVEAIEAALEAGPVAARPEADSKSLAAEYVDFFARAEVSMSPIVKAGERSQ